MTVGIIGLGLIGGSMAKDIRRNSFADKIIGYNRSKENCEKALEIGLIDEIATFEQVCSESDLIILGVPVNAIQKVLPKVLDSISDKAVVTDAGSTKELLIKEVENHKNRKRYVPSHPMSGTENSGPTSALDNLFKDKVAIICNKEESDKDAVDLVVRFYEMLGSRIIYMNARDHDEHVGYVSHLTHVISYALANAVLDKEKSTSTIFDLAAGGFASTSRLAKSSADMWVPIFEQNTQNILPILDVYMDKLKEFKTHLENNDMDKLYEFISEANKIRKVLKS
ncbi:MAG: prephenate dehydrogenase [Flavobacteriales bacterium]|nr:prephenate dehydrogenase [Flavobacteriales bacterium]